MSKLLTVTGLILSLALLLGACGGDDEPEERRGAIGEEQARKPPPPPRDQTAPRVGAPGEQACGEVFNAAWRNSPKNLDEAVDKARDVVEARVTSVERGDDLVAPARGEPGGESRIPTTRVRVRVERAYKGAAARGEEVTLFQTGNSCLRMADDPPFRPGETHLLLLEAGPRGLSRTISPEGRYKKQPDGTLEAVVDRGAAREVRGKRPADIESKLRRR